MILSEYDEERHMKQTYEEGREKGREEERKEGERRINQINALTQILLANGRLEDLRRSAVDPEFQKQLFEELDV